MERTVCKYRFDILYVFCKQHTNKHTHNLSQAELVAYKAIHGHTNVSKNDNENKKLGKWVNTQRNAKTKDKLSEERVNKLNEIGFVWVINVDWQYMFVSIVLIYYTCFVNNILTNILVTRTRLNW